MLPIYSTGWGVRRNFGGLKFWPKGSFLGLMKDAGIFLGHEEITDFFLGMYFLSAQIHNNIPLSSISTELKIEGILLGRPILKFGFFGYQI